MKRILSLSFLVLMILISVCSCGSSYRENEWYSEDKRSECLVPNLPAPSQSFLSRGASVLVSFSDTEYEAYVNAIYDYLQGLDLQILGTRGEMHNTLAGIGTTYYFSPAVELSDFYVDGTYYFVWGTGSSEEEGLTFYTLAIYDYQSILLEYGSQKFYYNTEIVLREGGAAPLDGGYLIKYSPITYADDLVESLCEGYAPDVAASGEMVVFRIHPLEDTTSVLFANDEKLVPTRIEKDYWEYTFRMSDERVVITVGVDGSDNE